MFFFVDLIFLHLLLFCNFICLLQSDYLESFLQFLIWSDHVFILSLTSQLNKETTIELLLDFDYKNSAFAPKKGHQEIVKYKNSAFNESKHMTNRRRYDLKMWNNREFGFPSVLFKMFLEPKLLLFFIFFMVTSRMPILYLEDPFDRIIQSTILE